MQKTKMFMFVVIVLAALGGAYSMPSGSFNQLMNSLENEGFSDDKLNLLRSAASSNSFTSSQVSQILGKFDFSSDQLAALRLVKDRFEDYQNRHSVISVFKYSSDKEDAQRILATSKPLPQPKREIRGGGGDCRCHVTCSEGARSTLSVPYDDSEDYMDRKCGRKASRFCDSNYEKLKKAYVDCGR